MAFHHLSIPSYFPTHLGGGNLPTPFYSFLSIFSFLRVYGVAFHCLDFSPFLSESCLCPVCPETGHTIAFLSESQVMDIFVQKVPLKLRGPQPVQKWPGSGAKLPKRQFRFPFGGIHPTEVKMTSLRAANVQKARTVCLYLKSRFAMAGTR